MARGSEGKQRRKEARKEARDEAAKSEEPGRDVFEEVLKKEGLAPEEKEKDSDSDDDSSSDDDSYEDSEEEKEDIMAKAMKKGAKKSTKKSGRASCGPSACCPKPSNGKGIKTMPLIFLLLMTGTTVIPALIYMSDFIGKYAKQNHIMGSIGHKLGIGPSPKRRVVSFYEKHEPSKVDDVPKLMSKYYGDYPKLIKRLERKYNDYGYFLHWQEDEAPSKLAKEQLWKTYETAIDYIDVQFTKYAPKWLKSRVRNVKYNLKYLVRKGKKHWKKTLWPLLEPIFGVPKGGASQKRKDYNEAQKARGRGRYAYRDEHDTEGFTTEED